MEDGAKITIRRFAFTAATPTSPGSTPVRDAKLSVGLMDQSAAGIRSKW